jgi:hypothetical protein
MKAFPSVEPIYRDDVIGVRESSGMDLRDYFAGQVIINGAFSLTTNLHDAETAKRAYEIADAMMKAREK